MVKYKESQEDCKNMYLGPLGRVKDMTGENTKRLKDIGNVLCFNLSDSICVFILLIFKSYILNINSLDNIK